MNEQLRLGFHRLARWFEDPVNLGVAAAAAWAVIAILIAIAVVMSFFQVLLLIAVGVAAVLLLRRPIERLARDLRQGRIELEREHGERGEAPQPR